MKRKHIYYFLCNFTVPYLYSTDQSTELSPELCFSFVDCEKAYIYENMQYYTSVVGDELKNKTESDMIRSERVIIPLIRCIINYITMETNSNN